MSTILVNAMRYRVVENLGFNPDIGAYAKIVVYEGAERTVVKSRNGVWRFWTSLDRAAPLIEAIAHARQRRCPDG